MKILQETDAESVTHVRIKVLLMHDSRCNGAPSFKPTAVVANVDLVWQQWQHMRHVRKSVN